jgi:lipopolysaccharide transport system permease protein
VTILTTVLMFLSPIFYPASAIPESAQPLLLVNPIAPALEQVRGILMWGELPNLESWLHYLIVNAVVAWLGFAWFQKTRKGFADVI